MTKLTYTGEPDRIETDDAVIANLVRKGWTNEGPYTDPPKTAEQLEQERTILIAQAAQAEIDAATGSGDLRTLVNQLMRAVKRVRREGRGLTTGQDSALLDRLEALADKVEAIDSEEARLIADTNLTVDDAVWPE